MQNPLRLKASPDTPEIILDKAKEEFLMRGKSLPEDAIKFFNPIHKWMEEYVKNPNEKTNFHVNLEYFNSSSVKQVVNLLLKLEPLKLAGKEVKIIWHYHEDDELMEIKGREILSILDLPFEMKIKV